MDLAAGSRLKVGSKGNNVQSGRIGFESNTQLIIKLPDSHVIRIISRSMFMIVVIFAFPYIASMLDRSENTVFDVKSDVFAIEQLDWLFHDLANEGLLKSNSKLLIVCPDVEGMFQNLKDFNGSEMEIVMVSGLEQVSSIFEDSFDFVFSTVDAKLVDHVVKIGGILTVPLSNESSNALTKNPNYKIVYLRRYASTFMAMKKIGDGNVLGESYSTKRRLFQKDSKEADLRGLEDALLEPPRWALRNSKKYSRKFKFLPYLLGYSLEGFRRRVFVNVGSPEESTVVIKWFKNHYPKKKHDFEVYNLNTMSKKAKSELLPDQHSGVSDWLTKNVNEEEFVVMKAEADVVEEMLKRRTIHLVDELFMECNNHWWKIEEDNKSKRAYWECLALYGMLRDEGVAVHQWWL